MITKQEQDILDNAPEGATHYFIDNGHVYYGGLSDLLLSDLRNKQGKQVWDAVNYYRGNKPANNCLGRMIGYGLSYGFTITNGATSGVDVVCTIEEFNQCVKEMSEFCNVASLSDYTRATNTPLEPVKPRTRVEYVKVVDSIFHLQPDLIAGGLFCNTCDGYEVINKELTLMNALYEMNLCRKVETEIKTEKRWLAVNVNGDTNASSGLFYNKKSCASAWPTWQILEITVEV